MRRIIFLLILLFTNTFLYAEIKIGYIFSEEIMKKFEDARQVEIDLEKDFRSVNYYNVPTININSKDIDEELIFILLKEYLNPSFKDLLFLFLISS